jgi:hypothetical protein
MPSITLARRESVAELASPRFGASSRSGGSAALQIASAQKTGSPRTCRYPLRRGLEGAAAIAALSISSLGVAVWPFASTTTRLAPTSQLIAIRYMSWHVFRCSDAPSSTISCIPLTRTQDEHIG